MSLELILPFLRPIEPLLLDEEVTEIMGNPNSSWWFEREGKLYQEKTVSFDSARLLTGLEVIANQLGKRLDEDSPSLHAQLPDGSRIAAWIPPLVSPAPALAGGRTPACDRGYPGASDSKTEHCARRIADQYLQDGSVF
jgi:pilus assembly protein CpaF